MGMSETAAKGGTAALQTVAQMMRQAAFHTEHKTRVLMNATKRAKNNEGGRQPDVVDIHAAAAIYGGQSKLNTSSGLKEVPMMVLCEWEGFGARDIDDDQMTWQPEAHFTKDFLRKNLSVLSDFKDWYASASKVQRKSLTWPLTKDTRAEVVCKPNFQWVESHPSLKTRLKFNK